MTSLEQARAALLQALESKRSSFYQELYTSRGFDITRLPTNANEWSRVPLLTKEDIMKVPMSNRLFIPLDEVGTIRFTSGTTGKGILVMPRRLWPNPSPPGSPRYPGTAIMSFYYYTHIITHSRGENPLRVIAGDRTEFAASAALAAQAGVDTLYGPASVLIIFARYLRTHGMSGRIRFLIFTAERASVLQQEALRECYPKARMASEYALQECGEIAYTTPNMPDSVSMRPSPDHYIELINEEGAHPLDEVTRPVEGELVITSLYDAAFPHIRYRTGDFARATPQDDNVFIEILNRDGGGKVRITGGELTLAELERAIAKTFPKMVADFECVVGETKKGGALLSTVALTLYTPDTLEHSPDNAAKRISEELRVNQTRTYEDGVARGFYAPLICAFAPLEPTATKRLHLRDTRA